MLKLTDRKWKEFTIADIFVMENRKKIQVPTGANVSKQNLFKGKTPRITATSFNNGVDGYYDSKDSNYRTYKNFISVSFLGTIFYHPYEASLDMKVHCLQLKNKKLNRYLGAFLISEIKKSIADASYGNQLSSTDLPHKKIMLPVNDFDEPDYDFMTNYVRECETIKLKQYIDFAKNKLKEIGSDIDVEEEKLKWKDFFVEDIFDIISGKDASLSENEGDIPYVNSSGVNNGITCFVKDCPVKVKNCITIARTGTVGSTFYQQNEVGISGNIRALYLKDRELNKEIAQFLITALKNSIEGNFDYGKILGTERIKHLKIKLPVDTDGNIDYKYMEAYIYIYISMKMKKYLGYIENVA